MRSIRGEGVVLWINFEIFNLILLLDQEPYRLENCHG